MKLVFATSLGHSDLLNEMGVDVRLLSYFYLRDAPKNFLEVYVKTGTYTADDNPNPRRKRKGTKRVRRKLIEP